jgi:hypothetical protein
MKKWISIVAAIGVLGSMNLSAEERVVAVPVSDFGTIPADVTISDVNYTLAEGFLYVRARAPHNFSAGDTAYAEDVNENFEALEDGLSGIEWATINKNAVIVSTSGTTIGTVTINAPMDGYVVLRVDGRMSIYDNGHEIGTNITMTEPNENVITFKLENETSYYPLTNILNGWTSFSLSKVYAVNKGSNTLHFSAKRINRPFSSYYTLNMQATMVATFYANRY